MYIFILHTTVLTFAAALSSITSTTTTTTATEDKIQPNASSSFISFFPFFINTTKHIPSPNPFRFGDKLRGYNVFTPISYLDGHHNCNKGCHCRSRYRTATYYADPTHGPIRENDTLKDTNGTIIAIVTPWYLKYDDVVRRKLEAHDIKSLNHFHDDDGETCGWKLVTSVTRAAVNRGDIEWWHMAMDNNRSISDDGMRELAPTKETRILIGKVLRETYPTLEITLLCAFALSPIWGTVLIYLGLRCCCRFSWSPSDHGTARGVRYH